MSRVIESDVLKMISQRIRTDDARVLLGPGDDLAHVAVDGNSLLAGVDQVIDGLHVLADRVSWDRIGIKAVHRAVSDIAAMAGEPLATLASVVLPAGATESDVDALCRGLHEAASKCRAPLVGGDVAIHRHDEHPLSVSVTVLATPVAPGPVHRSGACVGDLLVVTGVLGGSLLANGDGPHLDFIPRVPEAIWLHSHYGDHLHAMIDISDGLGRDTGRLAEASGLVAVIEAALIPCRGTASVEHALRDGEDYELLMAISPECEIVPRIPVAQGCPLRVIGRFEQGDDDTHPRVRLIGPGGDERDATTFGWDHGS
jgi:thiamine-monophosphate kinase